MYRFAIAILLCASIAQAQEKGITLATGVVDEDLADTPVTSAVNMEASRVTSQLSLELAVTAGTTTVVDVWCKESVDGTNYGWLPVCDTSSPSTCKPDIKRYTLADFTADSGVYYLTAHYAITKKWAKCWADDASDGTGTVTITGARSWR